MQYGSVQVARTLFRSFARAHSTRIPAVKRSKDDKEYHIQDWVEQRAIEAGCETKVQGRNSYPDFWMSLDDTTIGNEVKSLAHYSNGRPARRDVDFNSTAPQPRVNSRDCFLTFVLYRQESSDTPLHGRVTTLCLTDISLLNADRDFLALNLSVKQFGSYGDGMIRNRRMYRFLHPVTLLEGFGIEIRDRSTLILPESSLDRVEASRDGLVKIGSIERTTVPQRLASYRVNVRTGEIQPTFVEQQPQSVHRFEVWTPDFARL